jgi:hypothetical protein
MILSKITPPWRDKPLFYQPPFPYLHWVVWGFIVLCYLLHPDSAILRGYLQDADDYMYLNQAIDWLKGQSWYDNVQHRLAPPDGTFLHFTRLNQLPLALLIWPLHHGLGLDWALAGMIAAIIVPLALMLVLFASLRWTAEAVVPRDWSNLVVLLALFASVLLLQYTPGRVDHTGTILIIVTLTVGCVLRLMDEPERRRWPLLAGLLLAFGLAVALEILPWLLLLAGWIGFWVLLQGRLLARSGLIFGLALYLASAAFLALLRSPVTWLQPEPLWFSGLYVGLTGAMAGCLAAAAFISQLRPLWLRLLLGTVIAAAAGYGFLTLLPQLMTGPWGGVEPRLAGVLLQNISEAMPLNNAVTSVPELLIRLAMPLLGLIAAFAFWHEAQGQTRWRWLLVLFLLLAACMLTVFYQKRFWAYAQLFSLLPLLALLTYGLGYLRQQLRGGRLLVAGLGLILGVSLLPGLLLPALRDQSRLYPDLVLFPMQHSAADRPCQMDVLTQALTLPDYYGDRPRRIMAMINEGSELLFRTPHSVYAAPYHTGVSGNLFALDFFAAHDPTNSEAIARAQGIDLVVMCKTVPRLYLGGSGGGLVNLADPERKISEHPAFAEQLASGMIPAWLSLQDIPLLKNYLVFEVKPPAPHPSTPP